MARRSADRQSRLAAIREKLAKSSLGTGNFWKPKEGKNVIRILPPVGEMEWFWVNVGQHYFTRNNRHFCPDFTLGLPCPICELVNELYAAGDDESKELAGDMRVNYQYWVNVIDRNDEQRGPQIFTPGKMIFSPIGDAMISDPSYWPPEGEEGDCYVWDPYAGVDIIITRDGTGLNTQYTTLAARDLTPLHSNPEVIEKWLDASTDLTPKLSADAEAGIYTPVVVESYEQLEAVLSGLPVAEAEEQAQADDAAPFFEDDDEEPEEASEEEEDEIDARIRSRRNAGARRRRTRR